MNNNNQFTQIGYFLFLIFVLMIIVYSVYPMGGDFYNISFGVLGISIVFMIIGFLKKDNEHINFNNADYQNNPLSTDLQNDYYECLKNECGGNTYDYDCVQKCYLKSMKKGMPEGSFSHMGNDIQSMVCSQYAKTETQYYKCLNDLYSQYRN